MASFKTIRMHIKLHVIVCMISLFGQGSLCLSIMQNYEYFLYFILTV